MKKPLVVYTSSGYRGSRLSVTSNIGRLNATLDRRISSARLGAPVALFTGQNHRGDVVVLNRDTSRLAAVRGRNVDNAVRSIRYEPLRLRVNVTIGVDDHSTPAKPLEEVAEQVVVCNELFGRYGIEVEAHDLRVVQGLATPMTAARQDALMAPHLAEDAINILYFRGTQWQGERWRWVERSVEVRARPGGTRTPTAELFTQPHYGGVRTVIGGRAGATTLDIDTVRSVRLGEDSVVTLYDQTRQRGARLDLFNHEPDTAERRVVRNWWRPGLIGHCCHGPGSLIRNNQGSGRLTLAHEIGHWMSLPHVNDASNLMFPSSNGGTEVTFEQAEQAWKAVLGSSRLRRVLA